MRHPLLSSFILALVCTGLMGCANNPQRNPEDPWEPLNRKVFAFNEGLDKAITKPIAQGYQTVTPYPMRLYIGNFFNNVLDGWTVVNNALQLRPKAFAESFFRFSFNTFWGLGGFVNVADEMGFVRDQQDFGKTLGRWGVSSGPYLVLPVWGASTLRDTAALGVDFHYDLINRKVDHVPSRNSLYALELVNKRAGLLAAGNLLEAAALDKYTFTRNAFMQKRRSDIDALRLKKESDADYYEAIDDSEGDSVQQPTEAATPSGSASASSSATAPSTTPTPASTEPTATGTQATGSPVEHLFNK